MALFSDLTDLDLARQVAALSRELATLKRTVAKRGSTYYEGGRDAAADTYADIVDAIGERLPDLRRRAQSIETTAREHPAAAAAVGVLVLGLLATMLFRRR